MAQPIAVLASMDHESRLIEARLEAPETHAERGHRIVSGVLADKPIVLAISGFGKVAAAATVASVLEVFKPTHVVFGGVAGGISPGIDIGDIVVADSLIQHDFDASPLFERFVIPSLGVATIDADPDLADRLQSAAQDYLQTAPSASADKPTRTKTAGVHRGLVASGDRFINHVAEARTLLGDLPGLLAVEMEGAAVAQVCAERGVPFGVFRSISDRADEHAEVDFLAFLKSVAAPITAGVVERLLQSLS